MATRSSIGSSLAGRPATPAKGAASSQCLPVKRTVRPQISAARSPGSPGSYTAKLLKRGTGYISQKVGEEAVEVVVAALEGERLAEESADLLYHLFVLLEERGVGVEEVAKVLDERHR